MQIFQTTKEGACPYDESNEATVIESSGLNEIETSTEASADDIDNNQFDNVDVLYVKPKTPFFYRTYPLLNDKFANTVIFRSGNLYSLCSPGNQHYQHIIYFSSNKIEIGDQS